ncbi:MAG: hypothetical protein PWQ69_1135 [Methanomicrobiaceae archaeon]|nr:hypothetical protein [Methanomicrobiaceae archaeon]
MGGGCPPRGRYSIATVSGESITSAGFRRETPRRSCFCPVHGHRANLQPLPAPLIGAGGGAGSGRVAGVIHEYRSTRDAGDRGGGLFPSPSIVPGDRSSLCRQREHPTEILFLPRARLSGPISNHSPPPYSGRAEWLIDSSHRKTFTWSGGDSRLPPHIPMPRNDGKSIFQVR